jgi:ArsR family transcriptional regulator, arsenate/arsenite/antimonite-responsive transcriptional repressor
MMPTARTPLEALEDVFKALADKTRLRILALLGGNEVCVCNIHDCLGLPQPTVSRHLAYLRRTGLVDARREGVWMHYQLAASLDPVVRAVVDAAIHAMTHVPTTARDRKHYTKAFGELNAINSPVVGCCCAPQDNIVSVSVLRKGNANAGQH